MVRIIGDRRNGRSDEPILLRDDLPAAGAAAVHRRSDVLLLAIFQE